MECHCCCVFVVRKCADWRLDKWLKYAGYDSLTHDFVYDRMRFQRLKLLKIGFGILNFSIM